MGRKIFLAGIVALILVVGGIGVSQTTFEQKPGANQYTYNDWTKAPGGDIFYVQSVNSVATDSTSYGYHPDIPFATMDYAVSQADDGDVIYVLPGHVEDLDGATADTIDIDDAIYVIGLGSGDLRPRIDFNATADSIDIGADGVVFKNFQLRPSVSAVLIGIDVEANVNNVTIEDCEFMVGEAAGTDEFVVTIDLKSGNNNTIIRNNRFYTDITDTHCTEAINLTAASDGVEITDNVFYGNWSTSAIGDAAASTNLLVARNIMKVKDGEPCLEFTSTTTGIAADNRCSSTGVTCATAFVAGDMEWHQNTCVRADGASDVPIGATGLISIESKVDDLTTNLATANANIASGGTTQDLQATSATQLIHGTSIDAIVTALATANANIASGGTTQDLQATSATQLIHGTSIDALVTALATANANIASGGTTQDLQATATGIGTVFSVTKTVAYTDIVTTAFDLTGTSTGTLQVLDVILQIGPTTDWDTGAEGGTLFLKSDNTNGSAVFFETTEASLLQDSIIPLEDAATTHVPGHVLEAGKKIIADTAENYTSGAAMDIIIIFRRLTAGATIAAS
jgi:hypothetical protein